MRFLKPEEYQDAVEQKFLAMKARLSSAVPYAEIEHIGSSAIRGAVSKGDLDILVRVNRSQFSDALNAISNAGFAIKPGTLRTESLCMLEGAEDVAVQLIERGSEFEMFVRFRDLMNSDPGLVERYNALKVSCAGMSENEYRARKSEFIQRLLGR